MKKVFFYLFFFTIIIQVNGQIELKKKDVKQRLNEIESFITSDEYENALHVFFNKNEIISVDKVVKKDKSRYLRIKNELDLKLAVFNRNKTLVDSYYRDFIYKDYCKAVKVFSLKLNKINSYKTTRNDYFYLKDNLNGVEKRCLDNELRVKCINENINLRKFESVFFLFELSNRDKQFYSNNQLNKIDSVKPLLMNEYQHYIKVRNLCVENPMDLIKQINSLSLNLYSAEKYMKQIENEKNTILNTFQTIDYDADSLANDFRIVQNEINYTQNKLLEIIATERKQKKQMKFYDEMCFYKEKNLLPDIDNLKKKVKDNDNDILILKIVENGFNFDDFRVLTYDYYDNTIIEDNKGSLIEIYDGYGSSIFNETQNDSLLATLSYKKGIPLIIQNVWLEIDYAGGVNLNIDIINSSRKSIKYIYYYVTFYNSVDDVVACSITNDSYSIGLKDTGPIKPLGYSDSSWDGIIYNNSANKVKFESIEVEYMDGARKNFNNSFLLKKIILPHNLIKNVKL